MGEAPSLSRISGTFGEPTAEIWLEIQINDLAFFSGVKKAEDSEYIKQVEMLAKTILSAFGYLKATELMVFFQKFKSGEYGKFYGIFDNLVVTDALRKFLEYRRAKIDEIQKKEQKAKRDEWAKNAITSEQWERMKAEKKIRKKVIMSLKKHRIRNTNY
jgi:hypothetical protein